MYDSTAQAIANSINAVTPQSDSSTLFMIVLTMSVCAVALGALWVAKPIIERYFMRDVPQTFPTSKGVQEIDAMIENLKHIRTIMETVERRQDKQENDIHTLRNDSKTDNQLIRNDLTQLREDLTRQLEYLQDKVDRVEDKVTDTNKRIDSIFMRDK